MRSGKKTYTTPEITIYGDVEKITRQGGGAVTDLNYGDPVPADGDIAGNLS